MNRTVAVIGGSGKLGRAVVAALIEEGWTVVNFDRVPSSDSRARFIRTDLTDYGQVVEASPALMRCTAASMPSSISPPFRVRPSRPTWPPSTTTWCRPFTFPGRQTVQDSQSGLGLQRDVAWLPV